VALFEFIELFTFLAKISPIRKYYFGLGNVYAATVTAAANSDLFISGGYCYPSLLELLAQSITKLIFSLAFSGIYYRSVFLNQQRTNKKICFATL
jgi:hypothetical protein